MEQKNVYERLNQTQKDVALKIEKLLVGLTIIEVRNLIYRVVESVEQKTKIT